MTYLEKELIRDPETVKEFKQNNTQQAFMKKYKCSHRKAIDLMWAFTFSTKINISEVRKMIDEWKDNWEIAEKFWTVKQHISRIRSQYTAKLIVRWYREIKKELNTTQHEKQKEHTIEVKGDLVEIWLRPMQWIVFNKNSLQFYNKIL